jgi:uncharacterized DUF497 family protein
MKTIGRINGICYAVISIGRSEVRRIVSARRANRKETKQWLGSE